MTSEGRNTSESHYQGYKAHILRTHISLRRRQQAASAQQQQQT